MRQMRQCFGLPDRRLTFPPSCGSITPVMTEQFPDKPNLLRMAKAVKPTYLKGLAHPEQTVQSIENLLDNNVSLLVALAENSGLTHQTKDYLPSDKEMVVTVRGEKGQYADHLIDEHVALTGLIAALNINGRK